MKAELLFLNMSAGEIFIVLIFILMFFGSKSIPSIARTLGRTIRQVKDASDEIKRDIRKSTGDLSGGIDLKSQVEKTLFSDDKKESKKDEFLKEEKKKEDLNKEENKEGNEDPRVPYNPKNSKPSNPDVDDKDRDNQENLDKNQDNQGL